MGPYCVVCDPFAFTPVFSVHVFLIPTPDSNGHQKVFVYSNKLAFIAAHYSRLCMMFPLHCLSWESWLQYPAQHYISYQIYLYLVDPPGDPVLRWPPPRHAAVPCGGFYAWPKLRVLFGWDLILTALAGTPSLPQAPDDAGQGHGSARDQAFPIPKVTLTGDTPNLYYIVRFLSLSYKCVLGCLQGKSTKHRRTFPRFIINASIQGWSVYRVYQLHKV